MASKLLALIPTVFLLSFPSSAQAADYSLVKAYQGSSFFDDWTFYGNYDNLTNGDAIFVNASVGASSQLAYVNSAGNAVIKVDNTSTVVYNDKRNTVRIASKDSYNVGSLWVADMLHVPYGCSAWPSWWSQAPNWPAGGEIDTFEAVNLMTNPQMGLHTDPGCTQVSPVQTSTLINSTDCSYLTNSNQGCIVTEPSVASYGAPFASAGGGVWVTEFAESGISIWFFTRSAVPSSLSSSASSIDTSKFGEPVANWPSTGCNIEQFFAAQTLIFDITLCGDFAGSPSIFPETCSGNCYTNYVVGNGVNYATAYFEVQYVRVYGNSSSVASSASPRHHTAQGGLLATGIAVGATTLGALLTWQFL